MAETIAAVVVTYNRKHLLVECLDALISGTRLLDKIIIIDNGSTDKTFNLLQEKGYLEKSCIDYILLPENTGGAGGFYEGVKYGYEAGYDWLWLMDDDAEPKLNALEKLCEHLSEPNVSALSNLKIDPKEKIASTHLGFVNSLYDSDFEAEIFREVKYSDIQDYQTIELSFTSFVGLLVKRNAIEQIGFPKKEFFIHFDDIEYSFRLMLAGRILLVTDSIILHKEATAKSAITKNFFGKTFYRPAYEKLWLSYYGTRNGVWLRKSNYSTAKFYLRLLKNYSRSIIAILLFDDRKLKRLRFLTEAYRDGINGNFDNLKPKTLLYR
ncbi:glycosyltransferase family 2 protein [Floridanema evergladense]|uniref:Glycosyltransferase family 2 protein n=1 Tax=Floridaenema evergladense BLCC-F167 TaxID=3153639 RepID=A0ABV4WQ89_9CYAN